MNITIIGSGNVGRALGDEREQFLGRDCRSRLQLHEGDRQLAGIGIGLADDRGEHDDKAGRRDEAQRAAEMLGVSLKTLYNRLKEYSTVPVGPGRESG